MDEAGEDAMVVMMISLIAVGSVGIAAVACIRSKQALFDTALDETRGYF